MTADQICSIAEIIFAISIVALVGWIEFRHDQKKRSRK